MQVGSAGRSFRHDGAAGQHMGAIGQIGTGMVVPPLAWSALKPVEHVERTMPSIKHHRVAAVAVVSMLALITLLMEAAAKSKPSHAAAVNRARQSSGVGSSPSATGMGAAVPAGIPPRSAGGRVDCCAGWGNVGAF